MNQEQNPAESGQTSDSGISPEFLDAVKQGLDARMTAKGNGDDGPCELTITAGYYPQAECGCDGQDCAFTISHDGRDLQVECSSGSFLVPARSVVSTGLEFLGIAALVGASAYLVGPSLIGLLGLGSFLKSGRS